MSLPEPLLVPDRSRLFMVGVWWSRTDPLSTEEAMKFIVTAKKAYGALYEEVVEATEWEVQGGALLLFVRHGPKELVKAYGPTGWSSFVVEE